MNEMNKADLFHIWAPREAVWSPWVKPVLFAHLTPRLLGGYGYDPPRDPTTAPDVTWAPRADGTTAIVVDLPGPAGAWVGVTLAEAGYRPLPLYNACPGPEGTLAVVPPWPVAGRTSSTPAPPTLDYFGSPSLLTPPASPVSLVDVGPILTALVQATARLVRLDLPPAAPPAFLLDADRRTGRGPLRPGRFDNRSVSLPTDFPSANVLLNRGVRRVALVQQSGKSPQEDLAHTLCRWQEAGVRIEVKALDAPGLPVPCTVARPSLFRAVWQRLLAMAGLRRNPLGGFGGTLPLPSSG